MAKKIRIICYQRFFNHFALYNIDAHLAIRVKASSFCSSGQNIFILINVRGALNYL